jgi:hypothetical protein
VSRRENVRRFVVSIPLMLSILIPLRAVAFFQQVQGVIEMDGERFPRANPREKAEWTFARFHYDLGVEFGPSGYQRWKSDYPKADRQVIQAVSSDPNSNADQPSKFVDGKTDDLCGPSIYVENPGAWEITDDQASRLHRHLLRASVASDSRCQGAYPCRDLSQFRCWRCVGVGRQCQSIRSIPLRWLFGSQQTT